jgi:hypothetical protein
LHASQGHERTDQRSPALHRAVAEKLRRQPSLVSIARENLKRWAATAGRSAPYLDEWTRILDLPLEDILRLIEEQGERMTALRQCSPFAGVFEPEQRWAIYARFERSPGD